MAVKYTRTPPLKTRMAQARKQAKRIQQVKAPVNADGKKAAGKP